MIRPMALTPGGGRSPSTPTPPPPTRGSLPNATRAGGKPRWPRTATLSVLRLGFLIGGLVIVADLFFLALSQRSASPDEIAGWDTVDQVVNYVLFALLGVLVVRESEVMLAGAVAGFLAAVLDALVVTLAAVMVPPPRTVGDLVIGVLYNLFIGTVFAGLSGVVFAFVQRWSGGQRPR
jgi:hypothetical protein